jgi:hypothetical protein
MVSGKFRSRWEHSPLRIAGPLVLVTHGIDSLFGFRVDVGQQFVGTIKLGVRFQSLPRPPQAVSSSETLCCYFPIVRSWNFFSGEIS